MPQINLLSPILGKGLRGTQQRKAHGLTIGKPSPFMYYSMGGIIALMLFIWIITVFRIGNYNRELAGLEKKEQALAVDPKEIVALNEKREALLKRQDFLEKLTEKKFLWSEKLERITTLIPDGAWLIELSSEKKNIVDPVTKKPQGEQALISIKGRAVSGTIQEAVELTGRFLDNLKNDEAFSKDFIEIKLLSVTKGVVSNRDIMNFEFVCVIR